MQRRHSLFTDEFDSVKTARPRACVLSFTAWTPLTDADTFGIRSIFPLQRLLEQADCRILLPQKL